MTYPKQQTDAVAAKQPKHAATEPSSDSAERSTEGVSPSPRFPAIEQCVLAFWKQ